MTDFNTWLLDVVKGQNLDADYTTNSPSYYDDLSRRNQLMKLLAQKIWHYDQEMAKRFAEWDKNLEDLPEDLKRMLQQWMEDGTLADIINEVIFADLNNKLDNVAVNPASYGAVGDGVTDDTEAFKQAIQEMENRNGHRFQLNSGTFIISETLLFKKLGVSFESVAGKSVLKPSATFAGDEMMRFQTETVDVLFKGLDLNGLIINMNNINAHGITVVNAYDHFKFSNVEVLYCNDGFIPFNFIQHSDRVGQTIHIESALGKHYGDTSTQPIFFFDRYQEVNLIGTKAFGSQANTPTQAGIGYYFLDCKSVTMTGCSAAFCLDNVVIEARTKNFFHFTILGMKHESTGRHAVKTIASNGFFIGALTVMGNGDQNGIGSFELDGVRNSTLFTTYAEVLIKDTCQNVTIISDEARKVTDNGSYSTIIGSRNALQTFTSFNKSMGVMAANTPEISLNIEGTLKKFVDKYSGSATSDFGRVTEFTDANGVTTLIERLTKAYNAYYANNVEVMRTSVPTLNQAGIMLLCNVDGVEKLTKVTIGPADSAGTGNRVLRIPNNI